MKMVPHDTPPGGRVCSVLFTFCLDFFIPAFSILAHVLHLSIYWDPEVVCAV